MKLSNMRDIDRESQDSIGRGTIVHMIRIPYVTGAFKCVVEDELFINETSLGTRHS